MSECNGPDCTHPSHGHQKAPKTAQVATQRPDGNEGTVKVDLKGNRKQRRAQRAMVLREMKRQGMVGR